MKYLCEQNSNSFSPNTFYLVDEVKPELTLSVSGMRLSLLSTIPHVAIPRATTCCSVLPDCNWKSLTASPTNSITPVLVPPVIIQAPKMTVRHIWCTSLQRLMSLSPAVFSRSWCYRLRNVHLAKVTLFRFIRVRVLTSASSDVYQPSFEACFQPWFEVEPFSTTGDGYDQSGCGQVPVVAQ